METNEKTLWQVLRGYFNALPDKEREEEIIEKIRSSIRFHGTNLWILVFAILIASLGLNVNSTAVVIGAMLISPLMGPIIGMGLAVGISDLELLKRSFKNYLISVAISVITATLYFFLSPIDTAQSELLARTSPTLYDVLIAICGGAAGILALSSRDKGNVLPGVAIATALMPPLCTAGYGIAVGNLSYFLGAFYLFFINTVFIALSTFVGVRMLRFRSKVFVNPKRMARVKSYIIGIVVVTLLPAAFITTRIINESFLENNIRKFVHGELSFWGAHILDQYIDEKKNTLNVVAVGDLITSEEIQKAQSVMDKYQLDKYTLNVIQGAQSDSIFMLRQALTSAKSSSQSVQKKLLEQSDQIHSLEETLNNYERYVDMTQPIRKEICALFPMIQHISLSQVYEAQSDTTLQPYVLAVIDPQRKLTSQEHTQLYDFLKVRVAADSLRIIVTR